MIDFIDQHRSEHGVEPICAVLPIAPATYYAHKARRTDPSKRTARAKRDDESAGWLRRCGLDEPEDLVDPIVAYDAALA